MADIAAAALWVRPAPDGAAAEHPRLDLWRIPGRKQLVLQGGEFALTAHAHRHVLRALLVASLCDGAPFDCAVPWRSGLRARLDDIDVQARMLRGERSSASSARGPTRAGLLHLRALQAYDAALSRASQRDIAQVLFGDAAIAERWHADSELRAQVRHLLRRARALVDGGYLALAGAAPGGEPPR
ncbi:DUF2285 domain-containing protein [Variovorax sp.]|jgi:hypothetical protein|uniref:DUF2285 domain-containing protein n=1 Tax=Variovorax sp. TaxID=1871043 RepID=UPI0037D9DC40